MVNNSEMYINSTAISCCRIVWEDNTRSKIVHIEFYLNNSGTLSAYHPQNLYLFSADNENSPLYQA
jgi:hypothetical protein